MTESQVACGILPVAEAMVTLDNAATSATRKATTAVEIRSPCLVVARIRSLHIGTVLQSAVAGPGFGTFGFPLHGYFAAA